MSRQENEKNPQPKAEKTDNAAPLESRIHLLTIIGEVEGHESLGDRTKSTKYEEILPRLALIEDDDQIEGILILLHTVGGGHSIGVPLAVSADYSFIVPSATMVLHPVRTNGMFIGVMQTYRNMEKTQDRITGFIAAHSDISQERLEELMLDTSMLVKDVGTMLEGEDAVREGLINEIGGIRDALNKLKELMDQKTSSLQAEKQKVVLY